MLIVKTSLRPSATHGLGVFAEEFIPAGAIVWVFQPNFDFRVSEESVASLPEVARLKLLHYSAKWGGGYVISADDARFLNHSESPNLRTNDDPDCDIAIRDRQDRGLMHRLTRRNPMEIKSCPNPWCEKKPKPSVQHYPLDKHVLCASCLTKGPSRLTEVEAVAEWNRRPADAVLLQAQKVAECSVAWRRTANRPEFEALNRACDTLAALMPRNAPVQPTKEEILHGANDLEAIATGLRDYVAGRVTPIEEIDPSFSAPVPNSETRDERQKRVADWCAAAFGSDHAASVPQRGIRLAEEAIEAAQAAQCDIAMIHKLVDHVYSKPSGKLSQELGGVGITLLALAQASGLSADQEERIELERVIAKPLSHFAARNKAKNDAGFNVCAPVPTTEETGDWSDSNKRALAQPCGTCGGTKVVPGIYLGDTAPCPACLWACSPSGKEK